MGRKPLEGIRVVELADYVSGPVCCRLLADMGAEVIKIERPGGNVWRVTGQTYVADRFTMEENPVYDIYNTGKKHIVLNLKKPEGMAICKKLLSEADVFVTNNRVAALKRMGLFYDDLKEEFPRLVYAIGLGYGEKGPMANEPAYDQTAFWARSGFLMDMAPTDGYYMPVYPPASMGDTFTGTTLMGEICAALLNRERTGKGDYVRASLYHNAIFAMGTMQIWAQRPFGAIFPRTREENGLVSGYYRCKDGKYVFLSAGYAEHIVPRVLALVGKGELNEDPIFATAEARKANRKALNDIVCEAFPQKDQAEWLALAKEHDVPLSPMNHFADIAEDEQAWANHYVEQVQFANGHTDVMPASPIEMDSVGELKTIPSPAIGENTAEVLLRLGYSEQEICILRQAGVIN